MGVSRAPAGRRAVQHGWPKVPPCSGMGALQPAALASLLSRGHGRARVLSPLMLAVPCLHSCRPPGGHAVQFLVACLYETTDTAQSKGHAARRERVLLGGGSSRQLAAGDARRHCRAESLPCLELK